MFNQRRFICIMMLILTVVRAQEEVSSATNNHEGYIMIEEMSEEEMLAAATEAAESNFLRGRDLQTLPTCRATSPSPQVVCGMMGAPPEDTACVNSQATCSGRSYPCTCSGSSETSCAYCTVRTPGAIICQTSGSSMTYSDSENLLTTCSCSYVGNGNVQQTCYHPVPSPVALPTFWPVSNPSPTYTAPTSYAASAPVPYQSTTTTTSTTPRPVTYYYRPPPPTPVYYSRPAPAPVPQPVSTVAASQGGKQKNTSTGKNKNKIM